MDKNIDFVFAKMSGHPPWPSIVLESGSDVPEKPLKKNTKQSDFCWIYFFGSHNYAWIEKSHLKSYIDYRDKYVNLYKKRKPFIHAVEEVEKILKRLKNDSNYQIEYVPFKTKNRNIKRTEDSNHNNKLSKKQKMIKNGDMNEELSVTNAVPKTLRIVSETVLKTGSTANSDLTFGVLGIGIVGSNVVNTLIKSGHKVNIWNRTSLKHTKLENKLSSTELKYLQFHITPYDVMKCSDVVFNCLSDQNVSERIIQSYFERNNLTGKTLNKKGFIEMSNCDSDISKYIRDVIENRGGRYLVAYLQKSHEKLLGIEFIILTAGDITLFTDCQSFFKAPGLFAIFLGEVKYATMVNLILQIIKAVCLTSLAEAMAFADRCRIDLVQFTNVLKDSSLGAEFLLSKATMIANKNFANVEQSLENMQKEIKHAIEMSDDIGQPMQLVSMVHQVFKHCCKLDFCDDLDSSAIYMRSKF